MFSIQFNSKNITRLSKQLSRTTSRRQEIFKRYPGKTKQKKTQLKTLILTLIYNVYILQIKLKESTHKLFEICNSIVASSLQQTTWLRKNFAVKLQPTPTPSQTPNSSLPSNMANSQISLNSSQSIQSTSTSNNSSVANPSIAGSESISQSTNSLLDSNTSGYGTSNSLMTSSTAEDTKYRQSKNDSRIASLSDIENGILMQNLTNII